MVPDPVKKAVTPAGSALAAGIAALGLAFAVALLLSPGGASISPAPVNPGQFFSEHALRTAEGFRSGQRWLGVGALVAQFALLGFLAFTGRRWVRRALARAAERPLLGALAVGAALSALLSLTSLPFDVILHERAVDVRLSTVSFLPWLGDWALSAAISLALAALGALLAIALWRRLGRWFWLAGAAIVVAFAVISTWLWPVVVSPLFNDFHELDDGKVRTEVVRLAERAGVEVDHVYLVDASRRSTALNAYVNGVGGTKRVVIYDNAVERLQPPELRSLIAHELGHVHGDDIYRGLLYVLLVAPLGVLFVQLAARATATRRGDDPSGPAVLPALALWLTVAIFALSVPGNMLSRAVEARADAFALELTGDPWALVKLQVELARSNDSDPDPPGLYQFLFGTHPSTTQRIGSAFAFEKDQGAGPPEEGG